MRRNQSFRRAAAYQLAAISAVVIGTIVLLAAMPAGAQQTSAPANNDERPKTSQAAPASPTPLSPESKSDVEWLTAYMMAHQGYRLDHMPALEDSFSKMTPTQLGTLRDFYEQKHEATMKQQELFHRMQAQQLANAEAQVAKQQRAMNTISTEQTQAANVENQQINIMHQEAAEAAMQNRAGYPYMYGGYPAYPYGYGGVYGGYRHYPY